MPPTTLRNFFLGKIFHILPLVLLFFLWQLASNSVPSFLLPSPESTLTKAAQVFFSIEFFKNALLTLQRVFFSFAIAFSLANLIAFLSNLTESLENFWRPIISFLIIFPVIIATFASIVIFGSKPYVIILAGSIVLMPELFLIIFPAYKKLSTELRELAIVFQLPKVYYFEDIVFPQLAPFLLSSLRAGISVGWKLVITAEVFTLSNGVGYQISNYFNLFNIRGVLAWFFAFAFLMLIIDYLILRPLQHRLKKYEI